MMKLLVSIFLSLSFAVCCFSQIQFFEESANWKHSFGGLSGYGFVETVNTNIDTTINGKPYMVFDRVFYIQNGFTQERDTLNETLFFREEDNTLYQYNIDDQVEDTFIDFNMNVGDTINFMDLKYYGSNAVITVSAKGLDTIQNFELNYLRIKIEANGQIFGVKFNEKMGPTFQSLLVNEAVDLYGDAPLHRLCTYSSSSDLYFESDANNCASIDDFISASNELGNELEIQINPNPNNGSFYLETNFTKKINYKLLDTKGQLITSGETREQKTYIETENLIPNLYFLTLETENQFVVKKVFISN